MHTLIRQDTTDVGFILKYLSTKYTYIDVPSQSLAGVRLCKHESVRQYLQEVPLRDSLSTNQPFNMLKCCWAAMRNLHECLIALTRSSHCKADNLHALRRIGLSSPPTIAEKAYDCVLRGL